jgi:hypothetical protein
LQKGEGIPPTQSDFYFGRRFWWLSTIQEKEKSVTIPHDRHEKLRQKTKNAASCPDDRPCVGLMIAGTACRIFGYFNNFKKDAAMSLRQAYKEI